MDLSEKVAFLKGLMEGMKFDSDTNEGKVISLITEILGDVVDTVNGLDEKSSYLNDYIEELDEDLGALEEDYYEEYEGCDCGCEDDDDECDCCDCGCEDEDDLDFLEYTCPSCGEKVYIDDMSGAETIICPSCQNKFDIKVEN